MGLELEIGERSRGGEPLPLLIVLRMKWANGKVERVKKGERKEIDDGLWIGSVILFVFLMIILILQLFPLLLM